MIFEQRRRRIFVLGTQKDCKFKLRKSVFHQNLFTNSRLRRDFLKIVNDFFKQGTIFFRFLGLLKNLKKERLVCPPKTCKMCHLAKFEFPPLQFHCVFPDLCMSFIRHFFFIFRRLPFYSQKCFISLPFDRHEIALR